MVSWSIGGATANPGLHLNEKKKTPTTTTTTTNDAAEDHNTLSGQSPSG